MKPNARIPRRARGERELREVNEDSFSGTQSPYNPQNEEGRYSKPSQKTALGQELERFVSSRPRPCLRHVWRITLTREIAVRQAMPCNMRHSLREAPRWADLVPPFILAVVVAERLLIYVSEQVKRFHGNVGAVQSALQQTPEILKRVRVNSAVNVTFKVVNDLVGVLVGNRKGIRNKFIGVNQRTSVNIVHNCAMQSIFFAVW